MYSITSTLQGQFSSDPPSPALPPLSWSPYAALSPPLLPCLALLAAQLTLHCTLDCFVLLTEQDLTEGGCNEEYGRANRSTKNLQAADAEGTDEDGNVESSGKADGTSRGRSDDEGE